MLTFLIVEQSSLVFLKFYNNEFDKIIITFTGQNGKPLWRGDKVSFPLISGKDTIFEFSNATIFFGTKKKKIC